MNIAILGGTGDIGKGLALRWALDTDHRIQIGSRDSARAEQAAKEYRQLLSEHDSSGEIDGYENSEATARAEVVVLGIPPYYVRDVLDAIQDRIQDGAMLVTPAVGMQRTESGFRYDPPPAGSVTQLVRETAPDTVPVVGAFHNLPAHRLANIEDPLGIDSVILGDEPEAIATISELTAEIEGLRPLHGGSLEQAAEVEGITPLLVNLASNNEGLHDLGVRFT